MNVLSEDRLNVLLALELGLIDADSADSLLGHLDQLEEMDADLKLRMEVLIFEARVIARELARNQEKLLDTWRTVAHDQPSD